MNKKLKIIILSFGILYIFYLFVTLTGIFKIYESPTVANEPNLEFNKIFYASNLITPKKGDFICYEREDNLIDKHTRVHRLIALEKDVLEIRNGIVFINGKNNDVSPDLMYTYVLSEQEFENIIHKVEITDKNQMYKMDENTLHIILEASLANKMGINNKRLITEVGKPDERIGKLYHRNWNKDNFGPLTIPNGKVFVLGDNRDNSEDSRYIGLIDKSDIKGVVINN